MLSAPLLVRLRGYARWLVAACGVSLVLLIGFSRLYLGVHYPTDVLAGYLAALVAGLRRGRVRVLAIGPWPEGRGDAARVAPESGDSGKHPQRC